jgi:hypothetical protein
MSNFDYHPGRALGSPWVMSTVVLDIVRRMQDHKCGDYIFANGDGETPLSNTAPSTTGIWIMKGGNEYAKTEASGKYRVLSA